MNGPPFILLTAITGLDKADLLLLWRAELEGLTSPFRVAELELVKAQPHSCLNLILNINPQRHR